MRNADDWNEMEPFDLADEGATVSFVKATKESSHEGAKDVKQSCDAQPMNDDVKSKES